MMFQLCSALAYDLEQLLFRPRIDRPARRRRPAMLIVTRRAETRQGLGRSAAEIERRSRKEEPTPSCNF